jgi:hypothetical protein
MSTLLRSTRTKPAPQTQGRLTNDPLQLHSDTRLNQSPETDRTVHILPPNLAANIYLVNRLAGPPANLATPDDQLDTDTLFDELEAATSRIYGPDAKN